ncbi:hypothetical protein [Halobellus ruber]|uniref:Uncharacterized protein n=1 Tax=Halobellus ruber TaxID=2761102 RepID=A0A7J9SHB0_9EURY|nr:hypothetical protein [Halobellus ruber]MBB6645529.1 hypothetical protein [Halobellus ruber]
MGRFDDIKDKASEAKEKVSEAKKKADEKRANSISTALGKVDETKTKFKKPLAEPETRKEATLTSEKRFFICGNCGTELGPLEEKQYSKLIKPALKGSKAVIGAATGNPVMAVSNAAGAAKGASDASSVDDGGLVKLPHSRIKEIKQNRNEGEEFLTQCDGCAEWVCMDCWNVNKEVCTDCG